MAFIISLFYGFLSVLMLQFLSLLIFFFFDMSTQEGEERFELMTVAS